MRKALIEELDGPIKGKRRVKAFALAKKLSLVFISNGEIKSIELNRKLQNGKL